MKTTKKVTENSVQATIVRGRTLSELDANGKIIGRHTFTSTTKANFAFVGGWVVKEVDGRYFRAV